MSCNVTLVKERQVAAYAKGDAPPEQLGVFLWCRPWSGDTARFGSATLHGPLFNQFARKAISAWTPTHPGCSARTSAWPGSRCPLKW